MRISPEIRGTQIVMIGSFNPRIFRPEWFAANDIIGSRDAAAASIDLLTPDITAFGLDWMNLLVRTDRLTIDTAASPNVRIRDLIVKTFREFLIHTPIYQFGINFNVHFRSSTFEARDRVGRMLAPPGPWGEFGRLLEGDGRRETRGGLKSLTMTQVVRTDSRIGSINVTIEPSVRIPDTGIYINVNDHYDLGPVEEILGSDRAMTKLENEWEGSFARGEAIIDEIMALTLKSADE